MVYAKPSQDPAAWQRKLLRPFQQVMTSTDLEVSWPPLNQVIIREKKTIQKQKVFIDTISEVLEQDYSRLPAHRMVLLVESLIVVRLFEPIDTLTGISSARRKRVLLR